jgi:hypothetical protein
MLLALSENEVSIRSSEHHRHPISTRSYVIHAGSSIDLQDVTVSVRILKKIDCTPQIPEQLNARFARPRALSDGLSE